jgi:biopolymer transport protein ExbD
MALTHRHMARIASCVRAPPRASADMKRDGRSDVSARLLIIFMAALPLTQSRTMRRNIPPDVSSAPPSPDSAFISSRSNNADHQLTINQRPVDLARADAAFREILQTRRDKTLS